MNDRPPPRPFGPAPRTRGMTLNWMAPFYDRVCHTMGLGPAFRARTIGIAALRPGESVLDVGCGTGVLTRLAARTVGSAGMVWGIDPAPDMIRVANENAVRLGSTAGFRLAAIEDLPFEDATFDAALASVMIHHLPPDLKRVGLKEVYRILRPGGRLVVVDLDRPGHPLWWLAVWPMLFHSPLAEHVRGRVPDYLRKAGFEPVETAGRWAGLLTFWVSRKPNAVNR